VLPGIEDIAAIQAEFPGAVTFVIDACQARITSDAIADYFKNGAIVLMTGSRFVGAPPFNGGLGPGRYDAPSGGFTDRIWDDFPPSRMAKSVAGLRTFDEAQDLHKQLALGGVRLGQPVKCVTRPEGWGGTLRVGLSMPMISGWGDSPIAQVEAGLSEDMTKIKTALQSLLVKTPM